MIDRSRANDTWSAAPPSRRATIAGIGILGVSLMCIGIITLSPAVDSARLPFWCFRCGTRAGVDALLNVLLFVPVGVALGLLRVRVGWTVLFIVAATLAVETLQFALIAGRFASARDILANTAGGLAGWQLARAWRTLASPLAARAFALSLAAAAIWIATQAFTAWAMLVVAPPPPWWAQIRLRDLGFPAVFGGDVVRSSLGTVPIRYSDQLEDSEIIRRQLLEGATMKTVVTGVEPSAGPAPILLLAADDPLSEIAALVQTGSDVFFRIRTRAAVVGLRNPSLRLADVFPSGSTRDTIALTANYDGGRYRIESDDGGTHQERTVAASPSWIWALLMPVPHYSFGAEVRFLTAGWLFAALGLVGFWAGQGPPHAAGDPGRGRARAAMLIVATCVAGLGVAPSAFGLPVAHWSEWVAAGAGGACGWLLGHHVRRRVAAQGDPAPPPLG